MSLSCMGGAAVVSLTSVLWGEEPRRRSLNALESSELQEVSASFPGRWSVLWSALTLVLMSSHRLHWRASRSLLQVSKRVSRPGLSARGGASLCSPRRTARFSRYVAGVVVEGVAQNLSSQPLEGHSSVAGGTSHVSSFTSSPA